MLEHLEWSTVQFPCAPLGTLHDRNRIPADSVAASGFVQSCPQSLVHLVDGRSVDTLAAKARVEPLNVLGFELVQSVSPEPRNEVLADRRLVVGLSLVPHCRNCDVLEPVGKPRF